MGFGKDGKGVMIRENLSQALGTLGAATGILMGIGVTMAEDFRILKSIVNASLIGMTALEGEIELWMVNGELTLAEIEEVLEMTGIKNRNDRAQVEKAERFVYYVGTFIDFAGLGQNRPLVGIEGGIGTSVIKPRWTFSDPEAWDYLIYNRSAGALSTGANVRLFAQHFGVWVT